MFHELPYQEKTYTSPRQISAHFTKTVKTTTVLKSTDFRSPNEELQFAKHYCKFNNVNKKTHFVASPINSSFTNRRNSDRPMMKQFPMNNLETMQFKASRDEITQKKKIGEYSGKNDNSHFEWKSSVKKNDDYFQRPRVDDANYKRGLRMVDMPLHRR